MSLSLLLGKWGKQRGAGFLSNLILICAPSKVHTSHLVISVRFLSASNMQE